MTTGSTSSPHASPQDAVPPDPTRPALPELLAPAGDMEKLDAALRYGADAVYLGGRGPNLRAGAQGFAPGELPEAARRAHAVGARAYYCLNSLPHQRHLRDVEAAIDEADAAGMDALIVADPGVARMARRRAPRLPLHISTQANTANAEAALFWQDMGAARVNMARELDLSGIRELVRACPGLEFEAFVHGAVCLAVSGHCLLSAWMNNRPANLGQCTHPCRFEYLGMALAVEEKTRPGEIAWEAVEDGPFHSSFWAPNDLCLVKYVRWFAAVGVASLKIEGRVKSAGYVAQVTDAYRTALDDLTRRTFRHEDYLYELLNTASRPLSTGFFLPGGRRLSRGLPHDAMRRPVVARIEQPAGDGAWHVSVRAPWRAARPMELLLPGLHRPELHPGDFRLENHKGETVDQLHPGMAGVLHCAHEGLATGLFIRA